MFLKIFNMCGILCIRLGGIIVVDYGLKDRVVIVTGANNPWGIGATTAVLFAREGSKVVLVYNKI